MGYRPCSSSLCLLRHRHDLAGRTQWFRDVFARNWHGEATIRAPAHEIRSAKSVHLTETVQTQAGANLKIPKLRNTGAKKIFSSKCSSHFFSDLFLEQLFKINHIPACTATWSMVRRGENVAFQHAISALADGVGHETLNTKPHTNFKRQFAQRCSNIMY